MAATVLAQPRSGPRPSGRHASRIGATKARLAAAVRALPLAGLIALAWFLIRVVPRPSRAAYPCQRAAAPLASGFVVWLLGLLGAGAMMHRARQRCRHARLVAVALGLAAAAVVVLFPLLSASSAVRTQPSEAAFIPTEPANQPMGQGRGIHPGRVVWTHQPMATRWDGRSGNWWTDAQTDPVVVSEMLSQSLQTLTGQTTDGAAWASLFRHYNGTHGRGDRGYRAGERVAVKLNLNQVRTRDPGNASFTAPQLVLALVRQLVVEVGVPDSMVTLYDATRVVPNAILEPCRAEFPQVRATDWQGGAGREQYQPDPQARARWSQELTLEIGGGNPTYLPNVVTRAEYLINLAHLRAHDVAGVSLCAKNHCGSICASRNGQAYQLAPKAAGLHAYVAVHDFAPGDPEWAFSGRPPATYNPLVDLMGHRDLGEKTLLFMVDGLHATQTEDQVVNREQRWQSTPFSGGWTASLFLSQDGVAIDSVCLDFLRREPTQKWVCGSVDSYLHEAALADEPPSGVLYDPEGDGVRLRSLGVHEHWNNPTDKQYSGNLGLPGGIELAVPGQPTAIAAAPAPALPALALQVHPNPTNAGTVIAVALPRGGHTRVCLFDAVGQAVAPLADRELLAGRQTLVWDGRNAQGQPVASGVYVVRLETAGQQLTRKITLLR